MERRKRKEDGVDVIKSLSLPFTFQSVHLHYFDKNAIFKKPTEKALNKVGSLAIHF